MNARLTTRRVLVALAAALVLSLIGICWSASERAIHPKPAHYAQALSDFPALHPVRAGFVSRTGIRIAGSFFPGRRRAAVVLSHGYGDNQIEMLPYADFLVRQGFSVLIYDMRNRGLSGGDAVTLGRLESLDLQSAVDYMASRPDVDPGRIGAMGISLGGATTILAAAGDPRIKAVVDDSGFSDALSAVRSSFEHFLGLPPFPFAPITAWIARIRTGTDLSRIRPVDLIGHISPRPLLIVHCMNDTVVPPENSDRNFAAAREPKQFWRIPTGGHVQGLQVAGRDYESRVAHFFDEALR